MFWKADFQDKGSESDQSGLECLSSFWLAVWPWASCLDYLSLNFLMNRTERLVPTSQVDVRMIQSLCVKHFTQCWTAPEPDSQGTSGGGQVALSTCCLIGWQGFYVPCKFQALPMHLAPLGCHAIGFNFLFKILLLRKINEYSQSLTPLSFPKWLWLSSSWEDHFANPVPRTLRENTGKEESKK